MLSGKYRGGNIVIPLTVLMQSERESAIPNGGDKVRYGEVELFYLSNTVVVERKLKLGMGINRR